MKMKTKILLTILPIVIMGIIAINILFGLFFQKFILQSEVDRIHVSADSVSTYMNEISLSYSGTVNDWAHWDDTYNFIENPDKTYYDSNLTAGAMQSINTNFMIFLDSRDSVIYHVYYDSEEEIITKLPADVLENTNLLIDFSRKGNDTSEILKLGNDYYFVAASRITDSIEMKNPNGTLIIGRKIDDDILAQMEKVSGISITGLHVLKDIRKLNEDDSFSAISIEYDEIAGNPINVEVAVPNCYDLNSSIVISMLMPRTLYSRGMKEAFDFSLVNTSVSLLISMIIVFLVSKIIAKPFTSLINDVKSIDITTPVIYKISEEGKDEFSFLRKSINTLMARISSSQNELVKSRKEMYTTLLSIGEGIITVDKNNNIDFMNLIAQKMTGWKLEDSLNQELDTVFVIASETKTLSGSSLADEVLKTEKIVKFSNSIRLISKDGGEIDVEITAAPIKDEKGNAVRCVFVINDITEIIKKQKHIEYLSYKDILTGFYNRSFYERKIREFDVKENPSVSLILIDVNGLKLTNDAFGHEIGDDLLIKVAECIEKSIRTEDMVCRIGGDEFVLLLPNTDTQEVTRIIDRIHTVVENELIQKIPISISSGWATKLQHEKMESVFKRAEDMMYHNKSSAKKSQRHQIIQIIMKTLFEKNTREEEHSKRVSDLSIRIGKHMNLDLSRIKNLQTAALLHDIGKIGIDNDLLDKSGQLSKEEWIEIKKHPQVGHNILSSVNEYGPLANIVLHHHERWDGKGYPSGLTAEEIPLESRIITLADAYDAMINDRPYRSGMKEKEVLFIIENESGKQFDPEIVKIFLEKVANNIIEVTDFPVNL